MKTFQARYFFIPAPTLNDIVNGVFAYAKEKYQLEICNLVVLR